MRTAFPILGEFVHRFRPEHRRRHSLWTKELGTPHSEFCPPSRSSVFRLYPACTRRRNRQEPRSNPLQGIDLQPARCTLACLATAFDRPPLGSWSMMTSSYSSNAITFSMSISPPGTGEHRRLRWWASLPVPTQSLDIRYRSTIPLCAASGMPRSDSSASVAGGNRRANTAYCPVSTLPNIRPHVGCPPGVILCV